MSRKSKISDEQLAEAVKNCFNISQMSTYLKVRLHYPHTMRRIKRLNLDHSHFVKYNRRGFYPYTVTDQEIIDAWQKSNDIQDVINEINIKHNVKERKQQRTVRRHIKHLKKILKYKIRYKRFRKKLHEMSCASTINNYIKRTRGNRCEHCGRVNWYNYPLSLQVHHIDGDRKNNIESNLQLLCPNCHSITPNYMGKNTKNAKNFN